MSAPSTILLNGKTLTPEMVWQVADDIPLPGDAPQIRIELDSVAREAVEASRRIVEGVLERKETVYGINTGFGAMSSVTISPEDVDQLQRNLVQSHSAGAGAPVDIKTVRAMMLLRANTLSQGFSGVRPVVIEQLMAFLNAGIHPVVPSQGSLGASGDLAPLAHLTLALMGEGKVWDAQGREVPAGPVLEQHGLEPLVLKAKEGLALLNGTQLMTAIGVLMLKDAEVILDVADLAGAMTIEAIQGSVRPFDDRVAQLRPHPGHRRSAQVIRALLDNSEILESHRDCAKVQDPYSLRCIPQVHGAARDAVARLRDTLSIEINAVTDNPLIFPDGSVVSQGNFHGEPVSMALDNASMGIAEIGSIAERRLDKLMNPIFSGLPAFLVGGKEGLSSGFMIVHYTAASLVSENKVLAHPACTDSIPTSNDKEDHVSMGAIAARKARTIVDHTRWILAAELVAAAQGLEHRNGLMPGRGVWQAYELIRSCIEPLVEDRSLADDVEAVAQLIAQGELHRPVASAILEGAV